MPRERKRTTERGVSIEILESASELVLEEGGSIRGVARDFGICHTTLYRFCKKKKALQLENNTQVPTAGYWSSNKVFTNGQEEILANYLKRVSELYLGVTHKEVRRLAYQVATLYQRKFPDTWSKRGMAGKDWFLTFIKKNPSISIKRLPRTKRSGRVSTNTSNAVNIINNLEEKQEEEEEEEKPLHDIVKMENITNEIEKKQKEETPKIEVGESEENKIETIVSG